MFPPFSMLEHHVALAVRANPSTWCARCSQELTDTVDRCVSIGGHRPWVDLIEFQPRLPEKVALLHLLVGAGIRLLIASTDVEATAEEQPELEASLRLLADSILVAVGELAEVERQPPTRAALLAALTARNAAIDGDAVTVDAFSRNWLNLSDPARWREAVENALLGDWVDHLGTGALRDPELAALLHRHARIEHRNLQPLWERRVRGRRSVLLSQPIGRDMNVADLLIDLREPDRELLSEELSDCRLAEALRGFAPEEAEVVLAWAGDPDFNWAQAAAMVGHPDPRAFGERVRRKARRIGVRCTTRALAASRG
ncbi:hypothetical protein [Kitasatospora griseola]|uniref:hypothetical protein n=1 Tax=Kitasatospora griseola TaxID=2064 RepID=UPI0016707498|nr:hypothetical protein [Kitasatospora griseola]GGR00732.1 hypothetical protein GCM10010195_65670 [Kitasatospora griseola]